MKHNTLIFLISFFALQLACRPAFEPIDFGHDACAHCKMTIIDKRYTAELITPKGRAYKFDDIVCLLQYNTVNPPASGTRFLVADYSDSSHPFTDAQKAIFLHSESFKTPMNGRCAAFIDEKTAIPHKDNLEQRLLKWEDLTRLNP
ncbi:hypothetical protein HGH92_19445 [Chitinophaga varians]|uniref:Nitrous oxide reductase n=1 Tax=Chitinophaga varians TaxID=2202339 RepID=A0A847RTS2_9BACT|nr:nitrous oxide reductase accessory protein NosL [Chitinophaga varians]NLR66493.1 hypothetical protein [Chitinophaga varians]